MAGKTEAAEELLADLHTEEETMAAYSALEAALGALTFNGEETAIYEMEDGILFGITTPVSYTHLIRVPFV